MKRSPGLVIALVLLGAAGIFLTRLLLENFQLKVELANLKARPAASQAPAPKAAPAPASAPADLTPRLVSDSAREAMTDALAAETGTEKKLWLRVDPRDREASAFAASVVAVFKDLGWEVVQQDSEGMRFKPGLLFLVGAENDPASYVVAAQKAVEAIGQEVTTGRGYLTYYETKKRETPDWQGVKFQDGQTYVLLVGRHP